MAFGGKRSNSITALSAAAFALALAGGAAQAAPSSTDTAIAIMKVDAAMQAGKCDEALPLLTQLWDDPNLQAQDAKLAEQYRYMRIVCTLSQTKDTKAAIALSEQNLAHAGTGMDSYDLHVYLLLSDERLDDAATALDTALTRFPNDMAAMTDESAMGVLMALSDKDAARGMTLLDHFERAHWQAKDVTLRLGQDFMRLDGLRAAVKRHDRALADLYRASIDDNALVYIVSQGDGDVSDPAMPPQPIKSIIKKQINELGAYVADHPNELFAVHYLVTLEHMNEEDDVALVQIGGILDLLNANSLDKFASPESLPDLFTTKARLLAEAGKVDAAVAVYKDAAARMSGPTLFDFNMSYMDFLTDIGQDQAALGLESRIDMLHLAQDQRRQLASNEACAYAYLKDDAHYNALLRLTVDSNGVGDMHAYICAGDVENAAKAMIRDINDPDQRDQMISALQTTLPDIPYSPRTKVYYATLNALKKRPDVLAAAKAQNIIVRNWLLRF